MPSRHEPKWPLHEPRCPHYVKPSSPTSQDPMPDPNPVARRRTFAIISHPDAGKTTLTEKMLLFGGAIQLAGEVRAKANRRQTRSDWMGIERERGISVVTSVHDLRDHGLRLQPARHPWPRGLLRGHLPDPHRGRFGGHGDRRRKGDRSADPQAVRGLPPARHPHLSPSSTRWTARLAIRSTSSTRSRRRSRSTPRRSPGRSAAADRLPGPTTFEGVG